MEIASKKSYYNAIYEAIIVNDNIDSDPEDKGRVQIYIPYIHTEYINTYMDYMLSSDKQNQDGCNRFPWAYVLVDNLKNGNVVYCSYVNNSNDQYVIIGLDVNNPANTASASSGLEIGSAEINGVLDLAMPIIIHNEVGIGTSDWPNNIPTNNYIKINPYDNGGWSIGLIQWHHCRAFDCLYQIAKADTNWESKVDMKQELFQDIKKAVNNNSTTRYRTKYQANYHPTKGAQPYIGIQALLGSDIGKETQRKYASEDTSSSIEILTSEPNNIDNPAILIFLADIMNQYGQGLPQTIKKAASISKNGNDIMKQLSEFRDWCKSNLGSYNLYVNRRNTTYSYIQNLYNDGKLTALGSGENLANAEGANQGGQLLWPSPGCQVITSKYGNRILNGKLNFHTGVDLARNGGAAGQKIIAAHSGTISTQTTSGGYGILTKVTNGNMTTYYAHQSKRENGIKDGITVKAGQVIGYVGNTGNSFGAHLHFEVRINNKTQNPLPYIQKG